MQNATGATTTILTKNKIEVSECTEESFQEMVFSDEKFHLNVLSVR